MTSKWNSKNYARPLKKSVQHRPPQKLNIFMEPLVLPESTYLLLQKQEKKERELKNNIIISIILLIFVFVLTFFLWLEKLSH